MGAVVKVDAGRMTCANVTVASLQRIVQKVRYWMVVSCTKYSNVQLLSTLFLSNLSLFILLPIQNCVRLEEHG